MPAAPATSPEASISPDVAAPALRTLYAARFAFAIVWAGLFALTSSPLGSVALVLAVLYPAFDVLAAVVDVRSAAAAGRTTTTLYANMAVSAAAAVALAVVGTGDIGDVLLVWGAWAIASGAIQLAVGLQRRKQQGHVPMILSGAISVLAGTGFATSAHDATSLTQIAGYAVLGGVFFLVSALRLGRRSPA